MTPERWQQVKGVLQEALELAPEQRPAFLDRACSTDHSLRGEVESLLSSSNDVRSSFLQSSANAGLRLSKGTRLGILKSFLCWAPAAWARSIARGIDA
jgi:hypothetical protein